MPAINKWTSHGACNSSPRCCGLPKVWSIIRPSALNSILPASVIVELPPFQSRQTDYCLPQAGQDAHKAFELLEEDEDVKEVYHNAEFPAED